MKSKRIRIIWDIGATYVYDCTAEEFNNKYWTNVKAWFTITAEWYEPIIWIKKPTIYNIAHESVHAIHHIARMIWLRLSRKSEEFFSYNIGYLSREIYKIHNK